MHVFVGPSVNDFLDCFADQLLVVGEDDDDEAERKKKGKNREYFL